MDETGEATDDKAAETAGDEACKGRPTKEEAEAAKATGEEDNGTGADAADAEDEAACGDDMGDTTGEIDRECEDNAEDADGERAAVDATCEPNGLTVESARTSRTF